MLHEKDKQSPGYNAKKDNLCSRMKELQHEEIDLEEKQKQIRQVIKSREQ